MIMAGVLAGAWSVVPALNVSCHTSVYVQHTFLSTEKERTGNGVGTDKIDDAIQ